jgi:hypothetical protein
MIPGLLDVGPRYYISLNRSLYKKNTNHQQMHKESFIINRNTLLHVSTLLGHLQGTFLLSLHLGCTSQLRENVLLIVYCVVFGGVNSLRSWHRPVPGPHRVHPSSTQSTAHSHSAIKCNLSVTITKKFPEDDPAGSKHVGVCYD